MNLTTSSLKTAAFAVLTAGAFTLASCSEPASETYAYSFNSNGIGIPGTAYSGSHPTTLTASVKVEENGDGSKLIVSLTNTIDGESYAVHVHKGADPNTTPNGTPYDETPDANVLVLTITGNGGTATGEYEGAEDYLNIANGTYSGFFVVHDPTQAISTTNIATYLVVGGFPGM